MKRHKALAPLSREHHDALILAQLLKKNTPAYRGLPTAPKEKAVFALGMFTTTLQQHFIKEEFMLDKVNEYHDEIKNLTLEIVQEHKQLTATFMSLESGNDLEETLDTLGKALERHIRKEERILFPLIQQYCPNEILNAIEL